MIKNFKLLGAILAILIGAIFFTFNVPSKTPTVGGSGVVAPVSKSVEIGASYTAKDEVAAYIHTFGKLPPNFITKSEAMRLGWDAKQGNLHKVAPGKSIGGDSFGNREGKLPKKAGRKWFECDIGYTQGRRGAQRIVFSNDGLIYYTRDHYESFMLLYGGER